MPVNANDRSTYHMVTPAKLTLAIIAFLIMMGLILGMAFLPDNTHDFCIKDVPSGTSGAVPCD